MASVFFISDIHFGLESKEKEEMKRRRVLSFLDHVLHCGSTLFIVGDLFDAWIEYNTVIPKGFHRILTKIEDLTRSGISVHYLVGNHDFWIRDFFQHDLGVTTYADPVEITIQNKKIYLHHGDGLAQKDGGYRMLKKVLRNPVNVKLFSWIHPDLGLRLARSSSKKSRDYTSNKDYGERDGMIQTATEKINTGFDIVIMGHRHKPEFRTIGSGTYINLGDWISYNTYGELVNGNIELKEWRTE
jgi:UDP-2,3-diacylglucosamine hydrolase